MFFSIGSLFFPKVINIQNDYLSIIISFFINGGFFYIIASLIIPTIYKRTQSKYSDYALTSVGTILAFLCFPLIEILTDINFINLCIFIIALIFLLNIKDTSFKKDSFFMSQLDSKPFFLSFILNYYFISNLSILSQGSLSGFVNFSLVNILFFLSFTIVFYKIIFINYKFLYISCFLLMFFILFNLIESYYIIPLFFINYLAIVSLIYSFKKENNENNFYLNIILGGIIASFLYVILLNFISVRNEFIILNFLLIIFFTLVLKKQKWIIFLALIPVFINFFKKENYLYKERNFISEIKIVQEGEDKVLYDNGILHGSQFLNTKLPSNYYRSDSGVGKVLYEIQSKKSSINILTIGMGVGTISSYLRENDRITYIEINPEIIYIADRFFSYNKGSNVKIINSDGRIGIKNIEEVFDIIILDAFTGSNIPSHLLTKESFNIFSQKIYLDSPIVVNITNKNFNLNLFFKENFENPVFYNSLESEWVKVYPNTYKESLMRDENRSFIKYLKNFY